MIDQNLLAHGDNLVVLDALLPRIAGGVRCVYIDPPYNTGNRAAPRPGEPGYADRRGHAEWLAFMEPRLRRLREALRPDGSLLVQLDDNEVDAMKLLLDEVFGRASFINRVVLDVRAPSAFSTVNRGVFKATEYILWYARDRDRLRHAQLRVPRAPDPAYRSYLVNPEEPPARWRFIPLRRACPPGTPLERFQVEAAERVCRLAAVSPTKAGRAVLEACAESLRRPGEVVALERPGRDPIHLLGGRQVLFYDRQVEVIDGRRQASRPLTNLWADLAWEGIAGEGGVRFKQGKKPERLLRRCLALTTDPGDWVLDAFLGAGTTAAVAHKMGRRWVGIEQGPQVALCRQRLERVVAGLDPTGVTALEGWQGGGGFSFQAFPDP